MLHGLAAFLSAFLLFFVQPFICKTILPWFGGGATVWITCMLFFQIVLLVGYTYAHFLVSRLGRRQQMQVHGALIILALGSICFNWIGSGSPFLPQAWLRPSGPEFPVLRVMAVLALSVGLPAVVLSANAPLVQAWYARQRPGANPYRLYALSNLGSFFGLLVYPALVEPLLKSRAQSWALAGLFILFAGILVMLSVKVWEEDPSGGAGAPSRNPASEGTNPGAVLGWIGLSALGSALFLATNSYLGYAFYNLPMLWVLPLALYLLTFVLCFEYGVEFKRPLEMALTSLLIVLALIFTPVLVNKGATGLAITSAMLGLFLACLLVHGFLSGRKPPIRNLTMYYLGISAGGFLGGLLLNVFTPLVFAYPWEMPLVMTLAALLFAFRAWRAGPGVPKSLLARIVAVATALVCLWGLRSDFERSRDGRFKRDYYAINQVQDVGKVARVIKSARTLHGVQYFDEPQPIGYYSSKSGLGLAMDGARKRKGPLRFGIIGLGAGGALAYLRPGDEGVVYEISPAVRDLAVSEQAEFTYWAKCPAKLDLVMGDARLSLSRELKIGGRQFDVLLVDAFSGGNIPCHLLTRECLELYFAHLKPDGVLAMHLSNSLPVTRRTLRTAQSLNLWALQILHLPSTAEIMTFKDLPSDYLLLSRAPEAVLRSNFMQEGVALVGPNRISAPKGHPLLPLQAIGQIVTRGIRPWEDERHSLVDLVWLRSNNVSAEVDEVLLRSAKAAGTQP